MDSIQQPTAIEYTKNLLSLKTKRKPILWIVSNCHTFSRREKYVELLKQHIDVDIYGKCGKKCIDTTCSNINMKQYYFYLSFENSRCSQYMTEKLWNILNDTTHRLVPIVMGAKKTDYDQIVPQKSFIHVDEFNSPEQLAKYLKYLMTNPKEYLAYLIWREYYIIKPNNAVEWRELLCPLCQIAYEQEKQQQQRRRQRNKINFKEWYNPSVDCHKNDVEIYSMCKNTRLKLLMDLIYRISCP
ncbi:unnamed protein product [Didymodactylos carnosus]|uniref:Fucosyltransferase n=1 Tax=Didymodactylos carnosus TaxID=1234261 RepID=A0A814LS01_9BILA|nr:unnamed protein product [Didymodactylos carnosus]CAF3836607.1 unnamed protein product [Didymodactylos carnosus]